MKYIICTLALTLLLGNIFCQDTHVSDSLKARLEVQLAQRAKEGSAGQQSDTLIGITLSLLSNELLTVDPEESLKYANQLLELSEKVNHNLGIASALHVKGGIEQNSGRFDASIQTFLKAIEFARASGNSKQIAASHTNIGISYTNKGQFPKGLESFLVALRLYEKIGDHSDAAGCRLNIGIVHNQLGEFEEALPYFKASMEYFENAGDKYGLNFVYGSIGQLYTGMHKADLALHYDSLALNLSRELGNEFSEANALNNLAFDFEQLGDMNKAKQYYLEALELNRKIDDLDGVALSLNNVGSFYGKQRNYREAEQYFMESLDIAKAIGSIVYVSDAYRNLASLDSAQGNFAGAFANYKEYISARDSMFSEENTKQLTELSMQYEFDKKEAAAKAEQERKDLLTAEEIKKQKLVRNGFAGGFVVVLAFAGVFFFQRNRIKQGKKLSDELLLNILPEETAAELKATGKADAKRYDEVTVLFTDFKNFTTMSENLSAEELVAEINYCYSAFDRIIGQYGIEKIKTIGDSYMCAGGLPSENSTNALDAVRTALAFRDFINEEKVKRAATGKLFFEIRIGCHTGPVVAGIVGIKKYAYDIWGDTVNTASRMESSGEPGKVNISGSTYQLVKNHFSCEHRGRVAAKNKGEIDMYFVEP